MGSLLVVNKIHIKRPNLILHNSLNDHKLESILLTQNGVGLLGVNYLSF